MKEHIQDPEIQWHGCGCLHNLAMKEDHMHIVAENGGIVAISLALRVHLGNDEVLIEALQALTLLCQSDDNKVKMIECNLPDMLEDIILTYNTHNFRHVRHLAQKVQKALTSERVVGKYGLIVRKQQGQTAFACVDLSSYIVQSILYWTFVALFLVYTLNSHNGTEVYYFAQNLKSVILDTGFDQSTAPNHIKTFADIVTPEDVWYFLDGPLSKGAFQSKWYNGDDYMMDDNSPAGTALNYNRLLGGVRLRQVRSKNGTSDCEVSDEFKGPAYDMGGKELLGEMIRSDYPNSKYANHSGFYINYCYGPYSSGMASLGSGKFDGTFRGATPVGSFTRARTDHRGKINNLDEIVDIYMYYAWVSAAQTRGTSFYGQLDNYDGSGYVVTLPLGQGKTWIELMSSQATYRALYTELKMHEPGNSDRPARVRKATTSVLSQFPEFSTQLCNSTCVLSQLKKDKWIDVSTRAVFVDFTVYNAMLNFHCAVKIVFEFNLGGGVVARAQFKPIQFHRRSGFMLILIQGVLVGFVCFYTFKAIKQIKSFGASKYFHNFWHVIDFTNIMIWWAVILIRLIVDILITDISATVQSGSYVNLEWAATMLATEKSVHSFSAILMWWKSLKYLEWSKSLTFILSMLKWAVKETASFMLIFFMILLSFTHMGTVLFSSGVPTYRHFGLSFINLFRAAFEGLDYAEIYEENRFMAPVFYIMYSFCCLLLLVNIFVAILNDAYEANKTLLHSSTPTGEGNKEIDRLVGAIKIQRDRLKKSIKHKLDSVHKDQNPLIWHVHQRWLSDALSIADANEDEMVTRGELLLEVTSAMHKAGKVLSHDEVVTLENEVNELFDEFDKDKNGVLDPSEVTALKFRLNKTIAKKDVAAKKRNAISDEQVDIHKTKLRRLIAVWNNTKSSSSSKIEGAVGKNHHRVRAALSTVVPALRSQVEDLFANEVQVRALSDELEKTLESVLERLGQQGGMQPIRAPAQLDEAPPKAKRKKLKKGKGKAVGDGQTTMLGALVKVQCHSAEEAEDFLENSFGMAKLNQEAAAENLSASQFAAMLWEQSKKV